MTLLDTGFLIRALVQDSHEDQRLRKWLREGEVVVMSAVGWTEFLCGPVLDREIDLATRIVGDRLPFVDEDAAVAARLYNETGRRRGSLADCMIAATAIRAGAAVATTNLRDFERFAPAGLTMAG